MKLWFARVSKAGKVGLIPTDEPSRALLGRLSDGECIQIEAMRLRSVQFNKLYWAICREIGENQDPKRDEDSIDAELRILAGHYELMYFAGREVRVPKRLAFDKMGADEWNDYFKRAEIAIAERFGSEYVREMAA